MIENLEQFIELVNDTPLASSLTALTQTQEALAQLSDPESVSIGTIEKEIASLSPEFYGFLFQHAKIAPSDSIQESLEMAISRLGFNRIKKLIYFHIAFSSDINNSRSKLDKEFAARIWSLNYSISMTANYWAGYFSDEMADEIFYLGMFQNIGISAFSQVDPSRHRALRESGRKVSLAEKEKDHFGFNHYDIGRAIVEAWNMPLQHLSAMRYEETHGQSTMESINEYQEDMFLLLYASKYKWEKRKYRSDMEMKSYAIDPYFEYDDMLLEIARDKLAEYKKEAS